MKKDKSTYFKQVYEENKDRIYRICCCYQTESEARRDLFQEILSNIWANLERFEGRSTISTWIYRIAVNTSLGYVNKINKKNRLQVQLDDTNANHVSDDNRHQRQRDMDSDIQHLYRSIAKLPLMDRTIITLVLDNIDNNTIADICGISEGNVRVKIHRIKKNLQKIMEVPT